MDPGRADALVDLTYGVLILIAVGVMLVVGGPVGAAFGIGVLLAYLVHVAWKMLRFDPQWMTTTVEETVEKTVTEQMEPAVEKTVEQTVAEQVEPAVDESVEQAVAAQVDESVGQAVEEQVDKTVTEQVEPALEETVEDAVSDAVEDADNPTPTDGSD